MKKLTLCLGALATAAGFTAMAVSGSAEAPLKVPEGGYKIPCTFIPTEQQFEECVVKNFNDDSSTWRYDSEQKAFKYSYNFSNPGDDWCVLPQIALNEYTYSFTYSYKVGSGPENFSIRLGQISDEELANVANTQEMLEYFPTVLLEKEDYQNKDYVTETVHVEITEPGEYRIALYANSAKNQYWVWVKDIKVAVFSDDIPVVPTMEIVSEDLDGTISLTLPAENIAGGEIEGTVYASVAVDNEEIATVSGNPGETIEIPYTAPNYETYTFSARAKVEVEGMDLYSDEVVVDHRFRRIQPQPLPLGYVIEPNLDQFEWCTIINANEEEGSISWDLANTNLPDDALYPEAFRYSYSNNTAADTWFILPAYDNTQVGAMSLSFLAATRYAVECLEIAVAQSDDLEVLKENIIWSDDSFNTDNVWEPITVNFSVNEGDGFYVAFHCFSPKQRAVLYVQDICVTKGNELIPDAPAFENIEIEDFSASITFSYPEKNLGQNVIETPIYAELYLDGELYGEPMEGTAGEQKTVTTEKLNVGNHTLALQVYVENEEGEKVYSKMIEDSFKVEFAEGFVFSLPVDMILNEGMFDAFEIFNVNEDNRTWAYDASTDSFKYTYHSSNPADDWAISPGIEIEEVEANYTITVYARSYSAGYPELMEVYMGTERTPEGMTVEALPPTTVATSSFDPFTADFTIPEAGTYYIGLHAISDADVFYLMVNRIELKYNGEIVKVITPGASAQTAVGLRGAIRLNGMAGEQVTLMTMAGQTLNSLKVAENSLTIPAAPGLYVVKAGENTFKVMVK